MTIVILCIVLTLTKCFHKKLIYDIYKLNKLTSHKTLHVCTYITLKTFSFICYDRNLQP